MHNTSLIQNCDKIKTTHWSNATKTIDTCISSLGWECEILNNCLLNVKLNLEKYSLSRSFQCVFRISWKRLKSIFLLKKRNVLHLERTCKRSHTMYLFLGLSSKENKLTASLCFIAFAENCYHRCYGYYTKSHVVDFYKDIVRHKMFEKLEINVLFMPSDRMIRGILFLSCLFVCLFSTVTFVINF